MTNLLTILAILFIALIVLVPLIEKFVPRLNSRPILDAGFYLSSAYP